MAVEPVSESIGRRAGHLVGAAGTKLVAGQTGVAVVHVGKLGGVR
jgi:hypothetical protein